jgi:hypothetical protein
VSDDIAQQVAEKCEARAAMLHFVVNTRPVLAVSPRKTYLKYVSNI